MAKKASKRKKTGQSLLPVSKARTAWDLVVDARDAILAEPLRADMRCVVETEQEIREQEDDEREWKRSFGGTVRPRRRLPACGTVGCFAGWISTLRGGVLVAQHDGLEHASFLLAGDRKAIYGGDGPVNFRTEPDGAFVFDDGANIHEPVGTKRYAQAVGRRIDRFLDANEQALKARRLPAKSADPFIQEALERAREAREYRRQEREAARAAQGR